MKIGIDARFWNESGVGRYIRNLVRELNEIDKKNEYVLFVNGQSKIQNSEFGKNWKLVKTDIKWHTLGEQLNFPSVLNKYNLDLVHFPYFSIPVFYSRPFIVTIHDLILHHFSTGKATTLPMPLYHLKRYGYKYVMQQAAYKAQKILTVSDATKQEIIDHLHVPSEKIVVMYEGIDRNIKKTNSQEISEKYFLYVGNAYPHKNLERLFFAFSSLSDMKVKLIIVGNDDFFLSEMKQVAKQGFRNPNIIFKSGASDTELSSLYSHALALVSPSLMEGFGLPLVEAMKLGCLVIASDIPSSREICKDAAVYFDPVNVSSLSKIMNDVLRNRGNFTRFIKKGEERVNVFSWRKLAEKTLSVYDSCF